VDQAFPVTGEGSLEALTKLDQISVIIEDVKIADSESLQYRRLASEAGAFVAEHFFGGVEIIHSESEVNDPLDLMLRTRFLPGERVFARSFGLNQFNTEPLVFQNCDPELHFRQIEAFGERKSEVFAVPFHALLKVGDRNPEMKRFWGRSENLFG
jgi:hypothetical protein